ncbi:MAG: PEGA domain-containing protein, partial [Spirochaetes bacterium]|nr:PEGA domain-containing protein [Spirochaetota bacterium]
MRKRLPILIAAGLALLVLGAPIFGQSTGGGKTKVASFTVTIITNVKGASIFVDGARIKGNSVSLAPGTHSVRVTAEGYEDYAVSVNVTRSMTLNAVLRAALYQLTVNPDVPNAEIFVDGARIKGNSVSVPAGMHAVRVSARGYEDY